MKWMMTGLFLLVGWAYGQPAPLRLEAAYEMARQYYPVLKQSQLVQETGTLALQNLDKNFLPQINLSGQATYQSEVTQVKIPVPGINIEPLNKDQYKILADVSQLLYDGGLNKQQKQLQQLSTAAEQQQVEVELYKVRERINQLFLGVLLTDAQLKQVELVKADLENGIKRVEAQVANGVAFRSNLNLLKAELLRTGQKVIELNTTRKGLLQVLSLFINQPLPPDQPLANPAVKNTADTVVQRPELRLFSARQQVLLGQRKLVDIRNQPRASFFVQGGYGRPTLNFLNNDFGFFYTTGIRLNWSLSGLYTRKREQKIIDLNSRLVDIQRETFLLNTRTAMVQQQSEMEKLEQLITTDADIIDLRAQVKEAAKAQLENGVITANDYLREVNAEDQARQSLIMHRVLLLQAQINYQTISGK